MDYIHYYERQQEIHYFAGSHAIPASCFGQCRLEASYRPTAGK